MYRLRIIVFMMPLAIAMCGPDPTAGDKPPIESGIPPGESCGNFEGAWNPVFDECYLETPEPFDIVEEDCRLYLCDTTEPIFDAETGDEVDAEHIDNPGCLAVADENLFIQEGYDYVCEAELDGDALAGFCSDTSSADFSADCLYLYLRFDGDGCEKQSECSGHCEGMPAGCNDGCNRLFADCATESTGVSKR